MKDRITQSAGKLLDEFDEKIVSIEQRMNTILEPTRKSVLERFPIVFTLLTTLGVVTTFLGFELILANTTYLYERPWLLLLLGITILIATGSLYKKLG